jgi:glycerol-3-phosphate dehydrogenase (NAD(P)+)
VSRGGREPSAVVGGGAWGTALARVLAGKGADVRLWVRDRELVRAIEQAG